LWQAECNCPYWHGVFGGIYLPFLRAFNESALVRARRLYEDAVHGGEERWLEAHPFGPHLEGAVVSARAPGRSAPAEAAEEARGATIPFARECPEGEPIVVGRLPGPADETLQGSPAGVSARDIPSGPAIAGGAAVRMDTRR